MAELVIGMCLMVLLVGLVIPKVDVGYAKAEWERRKLCSEIRYIKRRNLAGVNEDIRVTNSDKKSAYYIACRTNLLKKVEMPENIRMETLIDRIHFHTDGKPYKAGTVEINYKKKVYSITITPISGRVLFKEGIYSSAK